MATLSSLTGTVAALSVELSKMMAVKSLPEPSFDASNSTRYENEDIQLRTARNELASAAQNLARLAQSPEDHILQMAWSVRLTPLQKSTPLPHTQIFKGIARG